MPKNIDIAYIAGFFDGEGHVQGSKSVCFAQKDRAILDWIALQFEGGIVTKNRRTDVHRLTYNTRKALPILEAMLPFLKGKKLEAEVYIISYT